MDWYWNRPKDSRDRVSEIDLYVALKERIGDERAKALIYYVKLMMTEDNPPEEKLHEYRTVLGDDFKKELDALTQYMQEVKRSRRRSYSSNPTP
jgi:hypothetical protein